MQLNTVAFFIDFLWQTILRKYQWYDNDKQKVYIVLILLYIYAYVLHTSFIYHSKWTMEWMGSMEYMFHDVW